MDISSELIHSLLPVFMLTVNPDFVKYAESYGANGYRVESAAHLDQLLKHTLNTPGVHLIDCPVDYADNDRILNKEIKELSAKL